MNAKKELKGQLEDKAKIKCAIINLGGYFIENKISCKLKLNHTKEDLNNFLNSLDFTYDSGYGGQELFGIVWLEDGSWLSRGEYDGSEWWEHNKLPEIPKELEES